jgi:hypothetical protein
MRTLGESLVPAESLLELLHLRLVQVGHHFVCEHQLVEHAVGVARVAHRGLRLTLVRRRQRAVLLLGSRTRPEVLVVDVGVLARKDPVESALPELLLHGFPEVVLVFGQQILQFVQYRFVLQTYVAEVIIQ